jgi:O-antigen/teichoic acid export membrane protein
MSVARTIAKNTLFNFITNASDLLINFGIGILLARFLGPEDYGVYSFLMWFLSFAQLFVNLGLGNMVIRFVAEAVGRQDTQGIKLLVGLALWIRILASIVVITVVIIFAQFWADLFSSPGSAPFFIILAVGILPNVLNFLLSSIFGGFQKYEYAAYVMLVSNPLRALGIIIVCIMGLGIREILYASIFSWILGAFIGLFLLRRLIPLESLLTRPRMTSETKRALKYTMIMTGIFIVGYFQLQRAEIFFLGIYQSTEAVGFYSIAFLLAQNSIGLVLQVFSQVLVPAVSEQFARGDIERVRAIYSTAARYLMMFGLPLAIGGMALAAPIINLFYGAEYSTAIPMLQILLLPFAFMAIANSATSVLFGMDKPNKVLIVGAGLIVLSIGLYLWLIPKYGAIGAAVGSSIPRVISSVLYIRFASQTCQTAWPVKDMLKITFASVVMGIIVFILQSHISSVILSLVLLLPLGVIIQLLGQTTLGVIRQNDIDILRRIQEGLPARLQGSFNFLLGLIEKLIKKGTAQENNKM